MEPPSVRQSAERGSERWHIASEAFTLRRMRFEIEIERKVGNGRKERNDRGGERRRHRTHRAIERNRRHHTLPVASVSLHETNAAPETVEVITDRAHTDGATYDVA